MTNLQSWYGSMFFGGLTPLFFYMGVLNKEEIFFVLTGISAFILIIFFFSGSSKTEIKERKEAVKTEAKKFNPYKIAQV